MRRRPRKARHGREFERANAADLSALLARAECSQYLQLLRGEKLDMNVRDMCN